MPLRPAKNAATFLAPAKINLSLLVRGRRDDGYHLLDSLVVFADVGDVVTAKVAKDVRMTMRGPFVRALLGSPDNLVLRAARFLKAAYDIKQGADLVLEKNLPVAAGIGGGSSDAAATLRACAQIWNADLTRFPDRDIAKALGADAPVCLRRRPTFMSGIGEILEDAPPLPPAWLVLVNPGVPLATKDVFQALAGRYTTGDQRPDLTHVRDAAQLAEALRGFGNDLAAPAAERVPVIGDTLKAIETTPGCLLARLSGSGPTCFGLFADEPSARAAADALKAKGLPWVSPARLLPADASFVS